MDDIDMILKTGDNITYGGYTVDSTFLNSDIPISYNINDNLIGGKSLPAGLLFLNTESIPEIKDIEVKGLVDSTVYDKFIEKFSRNINETSDKISPIQLGRRKYTKKFLNSKVNKTRTKH